MILNMADVQAVNSDVRPLKPDSASRAEDCKPLIDSFASENDPRLPAHRPFKELEPFDRALTWFICTLQGTWQCIEWSDLSHVQETALNRLIEAGLVEARTEATSRMDGFPERVRLTCRVTGDYQQLLYHKTISQVPRWLTPEGKMKGFTTFQYDIMAVRLADEGELARHDWRSRAETTVLAIVRGVHPNDRGIRPEGRVGIEERHIAKESPVVASTTEGAPYEVRAPVATCKVVFCVANPPDSARLAVDEEIRAIRAMIRATDYRDSIVLIEAWAARPDDLLQSLNEHRPRVVHFSGHGGGSRGLVFAAEDGSNRWVTGDALEQLLRAFRGSVQLVVLNACRSDEQAKALIGSVDCVIAMRTDIDDTAARIFATSLYRAIGFGESVAKAFEQGKAALALHETSQEDRPVLFTKIGVDARRVMLVR